MDASCPSQFSGPHVDSMETVADQRLRDHEGAGSGGMCLIALNCSWKMDVCETQWHSETRLEQICSIPSLEYQFRSFLLVFKLFFLYLNCIGNVNGFEWGIATPSNVVFLGFSLRPPSQQQVCSAVASHVSLKQSSLLAACLLDVFLRVPLMSTPAR